MFLANWCLENKKNKQIFCIIATTSSEINVVNYRFNICSFATPMVSRTVGTFQPTNPNPSCRMMPTLSSHVPLPRPSYTQARENLVRAIPPRLLCLLACGGRDCRYEGPECWKANQQAIRGLFSSWWARPLAADRPRFYILERWLKARECIELHPAAGSPKTSSPWPDHPVIWLRSTTSSNSFTGNFCSRGCVHFIGTWIISSGILISPVKSRDNNIGSWFGHSLPEQCKYLCTDQSTAFSKHMPTKLNSWTQTLFFSSCQVKHSIGYQHAASRRTWPLWTDPWPHQWLYVLTTDLHGQWQWGPQI